LISNENTDSVLSYPKYLTSQDLFDLQLQDSSFRKTILVQFIIVFRSFLRPVTPSQKKYFIFSDIQKKQIKDTLTRIRTQLNGFKIGGKGFLQGIQNIFKNEEIWESWKETGCKSYEKVPSKDLINNIKNATEKVSNRALIEPTRYAINTEITPSYNFNNDLLKYLDSSGLQDISKNLTTRAENDNQFLSNYLERVYHDNNSNNEIEDEYKSKNEPSFQWRFFRLLSQNELHKFEKFNDGNIEKISKDYLEKYGKVKNIGIDNVVTPMNTNTPIIDDKFLAKKKKSSGEISPKENGGSTKEIVMKEDKSKK